MLLKKQVDVFVAKQNKCRKRKRNNTTFVWHAKRIKKYVKYKSKDKICVCLCRGMPWNEIRIFPFFLVLHIICNQYVLYVRTLAMTTRLICIRYRKMNFEKLSTLFVVAVWPYSHLSHLVKSSHRIATRETMAPTKRLNRSFKK